MSINRGMKNVVHIHNRICYSAIKKNEIMLFATPLMDIEIVTLSEVSQIEKERYHMKSLIGRIEKEIIQMNLFINHKQIHRLKEKNLCLPGGKE